MRYRQGYREGHRERCRDVIDRVAGWCTGSIARRDKGWVIEMVTVSITGRNIGGGYRMGYREG